MDSFLNGPIPVLLGLVLVAFYFFRRLNGWLSQSGEWFETKDGRMCRYDKEQRRWHYRSMTDEDRANAKSDRSI